MDDTATAELRRQINRRKTAARLFLQEMTKHIEAGNWVEARHLCYVGIPNFEALREDTRRLVAIVAKARESKADKTNDK